MNILRELIDSVIEHYESKEGHRSTRSLIDVTMMKVIRVLGGDLIEDSKVFSVLPYDYFEKWET
jgi:hypothetical protein